MTLGRVPSIRGSAHLNKFVEPMRTTCSWRRIRYAIIDAEVYGNLLLEKNALCLLLHSVFVFDPAVLHTRLFGRVYSSVAMVGSSRPPSAMDRARRRREWHCDIAAIK